MMLGEMLATNFPPEPTRKEAAMDRFNEQLEAFSVAAQWHGYQCTNATERAMRKAEMSVRVAVMDIVIAYES